MKRFALCLMVSFCVLSLPALAAEKKATAAADCEKACSGTNKGCAAACLKSAPCISACTASYKTCSAGCKK